MVTASLKLKSSYVGQQIDGGDAAVSIDGHRRQCSSSIYILIFNGDGRSGGGGVVDFFSKPNYS